MIKAAAAEEEEEARKDYGKPFSCSIDIFRKLVNREIRLCSSPLDSANECRQGKREREGTVNVMHVQEAASEIIV
jgi:hypothetical protein